MGEFKAQYCNVITGYAEKGILVGPAEVTCVLVLIFFFMFRSKPRGYGFCEYMNPETALCAMRNLNGYEIGGRTLRVDSACTEKNQMMQALGGATGNSGTGNVSQGIGGLVSGAGSMDSGPYGESVDPEKAPEAISKAVASLPPEQMFELMKQMKMCIQNNPQEARNMLLQNPQLAYALLQAQVVMRYIN